MSKLFVCEKLHAAREIVKVINDDDAIILCPSIASYKYKFPDQLKFADIPYTDRVPLYTKNYDQYRPKWLGRCHSLVITRRNEAVNATLMSFYEAQLNDAQADKNALHGFLGSFDEVVFACDADLTGMRGFDFLFHDYFGIKDLKSFAVESNTYFTACIFAGYDNQSLRAAVENRSSFFDSEVVRSLRESYLKKDFFEYNYSLNSLLILNKTFFHVAGNYPSQVITKNCVQALLLMERDGIVSIGKAVSAMNKKHIGSPASQVLIITSLMGMGLLVDHPRNVEVSKLGREFLSVLCSKMKDPHLSERLEVDLHGEMSLADFKGKYSRYLSTCFGKQKRKLNTL
ncbi:hypothetical protein [Vibrio harveyi]|uniref:hypothetical protein n=1 Tax=Vibrio harveyi TaxID=669 RepID=UPI003CE97145